jgi:hypothetical protein
MRLLMGHGHRYNIQFSNGKKNMVAGQKKYMPENTMVAKHQQDHLLSEGGLGKKRKGDRLKEQAVIVGTRPGQKAQR